MGRQKELYMQEMYNRQESIQTGFDIDHELREHEFNNQQNQINMSRKTKMKKVETTATEEPVVETRKDTLNRLFKENNLSKDDVYKDTRGFAIITRTGIDKIVSKNNISVAYEPVVMDREWVVMKAVASMKGNKGEVRNMMSFGEASDSNLMGGGKKFPVAMAEKRAMSRVVLKIAGFYEQGVFGQDEIIDDEKQ